MQHKHVVLGVAMLAAVVALAVVVEPALAQSKSPDEIGEGVKDTIVGITLPVVIVATGVAIIFAGFQRNASMVLVLVIFCALGVTFLAMPNEVEGLMKGAMKNIVGLEK